MVDGYIRKLQRKLNNQIIPQIINDICFKYYYYGFIQDGWDKSLNKGDKFRKYKKNIVTTKSDIWRSVYLKDNIFNGIHEYKFKLIDGPRVTLGIVAVQVNKSHISNAYPFTERIKSYSFTLNYAKKYKNGFVVYEKYGIICKANDILTMTVNFNGKTLSYSINGRDYGKCFDIDIDEKYQPAARIGGSEHGIEFIQHRWY